MVYMLIVICTYQDCDPKANIVTIGVPVPSYFCYILDSNLQPVPAGTAGELHIGGICVSRGYVNRDDLTQEKFIKFPNSILPDNDDLKLNMTDICPKLYKSGDLARFTLDGQIEFLGRIDAQV
jgi:microcystin synthetase protein McyA